MGKLIVIEGLDGSGKATQAKLLYDYLTRIGHRANKVSFPDYESNSSALVKMYLNGEFGEDPNLVNAYAASSFYAVDRYASYMRNWGKMYHEGNIVIADRYTTSNMIHQCSKLPKEQWKNFNKWLYEYEYKLLGIPEPSLVIYLQTDIDIGQKLMNDRYMGDEKKKDIHERDVNYLMKCQEAAEFCAAEFGWCRIQCINSAHSIKSIEEIQEMIVQEIQQVFD